MLKTAKGFLFDLNGTMIDDMQYHKQVWYDILTKELGADLSWEQVASHMYGKNVELLIRIFGPDHFTMEEMDRLSVEKEKKYQELYKPQLKGLPGLETFLEKAKQKEIKMGIGSAAILFNIDFAIDGLNIRHYFDSIVGAENVKDSKPDPETYLKGAKELNLNPSDCIVFEDAPKGVEAALNAGMKAVVLTTMHIAEEFSEYPNVIAFAKDYTTLIPLLD
ncbi:MAG: HAD family hydrolase [Bacteroidota bacterium]